MESREALTSPEESSLAKVYSSLKIIEYLLLTASICTVLLFYFAIENQQTFGLYLIGFLSALFFVFLIKGQVGSSLERLETQSDIITKSEIQNSMLDADEGTAKTKIAVARTRALKYSQELINDYKRTRVNSRNIYYISQISTVILSGVTPILVVVERLDTGPSWFKWLPVIFPAISAIVSSIITSFPFQERWIAANKTVELLEAEQEKFILGISQAYRCTDVSEPQERQKRAQLAIENFITQVNTIHLKQIQQVTAEKQEGEKKEEKTESNSPAAVQA